MTTKRKITRAERRAAEQAVQHRWNERYAARDLAVEKMIDDVIRIHVPSFDRETMDDDYGNLPKWLADTVLSFDGYGSDVYATADAAATKASEEAYDSAFLTAYKAAMDREMEDVEDRGTRTVNIVEAAPDPETVESDHGNVHPFKAKGSPA
jgi:hypothetical protein